MNVRTTPILAFACGLLALFSVSASAQTPPTLTATVDGARLTMNWTDVRDAIAWRIEAGLTAGGSEIAAVIIPNGPRARPVVINPVPQGTYYVRVRAIVSGIPVSPASNEVIVVVSGAACSTIAAPNLSSTVNGQNATFNWNSVTGAAGYRLRFGTSPGRTDLEHQLSSSTTSYTQNVPITGTFYARVIATNACGQTAESNERAFTIGGSSCTTQNPALTASVQGGNVTFTWTGVSNATAVALDYGFNAGQVVATDEANPASTSHQRYVPQTGTFHARLAVTTACGVTHSSWISFTITTLNSGSGTRTPDPAPGRLLPVPNYGEAVAEDVGRRFAGDLANACHSRTWLFRLIQELRRRDTRWGLNWKRGHAGEMSTDIAAYNPTNQPDEGNGQVYIFDVITAICESNLPSFHDVTAHTWSFRGSPECGAGTYCTKWTLQPYRNAGFPPDEPE